MVAATQTKKVTIENVWEELEVGLNTAYAREEMTSKRYMELYTIVYNFCSQTQLDPERIRTICNKTNNGAEFVGREVYERLKSYMVNYVVNLKNNGADRQGENLLEYYTKEWQNYRFSSKVTNGIVGYLNRHWINRELEEGHDDVYIIYTLALMIWKEEMFAKLSDGVLTAVLELIRREREGEVINVAFVSGVVESLVELGIDEYESTKDSGVDKKMVTDQLKVYRINFEDRFLQATCEFYRRESIDFLMKHGSITDYMIKIEKRLAEEEKRCDLYLNSHTKPLLAKCCEDRLIKDQLELFQAAFGQLLETSQDEHLARMYKLCQRVENGLDELRTALENHVTKEGLAALERVAAEAATDPKIYVQTLLSIHERYSNLVQQSFSNDSGFMQALDKAATKFINQNAVTSRTQKMQRAPANSKSAELLAKYCDILLKKSARMPDDHEMDAMLKKMMIIFKYIEEKDTFLKYYTKFFSKRLIFELSASEEAEQSLINKLKDMCGFEYTSRLAKMVTDTQVSKDLYGSFKEKTQQDGVRLGFDFNILVLSSGSWPQMPQLTISLPARLGSAVEQFTHFYNNKFSGRKLTWVYSQSRAEVLASCLPRKYVFTVTTVQMAALLLFNDHETYDINRLQESLGVDRKTAVGVVQSLAKNDVLKLTGEVTSEDIPDGTIISINPDYSNKKIKVDLSKQAIRGDAQKENEMVQRSVDEDRKGIVNAAIVRIMKTRKSLSHSQLISEVIQQLSHRFRPKVEMIKKCIGQMIEKDYIKRSEEQRDVYQYIA